MLMLTRTEVERLLAPGDYIDLIERAFARTDALPSRLSHLDSPPGEFHVKASGLGEVVGVKIGACFYDRPATLGLPSIVGVIALFDGSNGQPLLFLESATVTRLRTAAATAVAVRHLALPEACTLAILGTGAQAAAHLAAIRAVRPITHVRIWSRTPANAESFATTYGSAPTPTAVADGSGVGPRRASVRGGGATATAAVPASTGLPDDTDRAPLPPPDPRTSAIADTRDVPGTRGIPATGSGAVGRAGEGGETAGGIEVVAVGSVEEAVRGADIVVTLTPSTEPYLRLAHLKPGAMVAAVGSDAPHKRELHDDVLAAAALVTDVTHQCAEVGELHHRPHTPIRAQLSEIIRGETPGRLTEQEIIVFDSTGTAIQDVAAAQALYVAAKETGAGKTLPLWE